MIYSYLDILDRSKSGVVVKKDDWDLDWVVIKTRDIVRKYGLKWDKNVITPDDPGLADTIFEAAMELAAETGVFCPNTGRVIQFDRSELEIGLQRAPRELVMGEGKDVRVLKPRKIGDSQRPMAWGGNPGVPTPEELFMPSVMSWMQEPLVDLATCGSLTHLSGRTIETGAPLEIHAVRRELAMLRDSLRRVGRPGMGLLAAQSAVTELGDVAVAHPDYLRPVDSHLVAMFNELILDQSNMARAVNSLEYGMRNASLATVMIGGLGGDAPGAAVVQAASFIFANWVCWADYHLLHPIHIRHVATSTRGVMWVQNVVEQAFARNASCVIVSDIYPKSGAMTRELLYEVAANALAITTGGGHLEGVGSADGGAPNGTGLEVRWMAEVGRAAATMELSPAQGNQLILKLLDKYEHVFQIPGGNPGMRFDKAYDMTTLRPLPEWEGMYQEVKTEVRQMGLAALS